MRVRSSGMTALQFAKEKGHAECVEAFRTYLGEVTAARSKAPSAEAGGAGASGAPAGEAAAGASAAASALIGEGGMEAEPSGEAVPEEVVLAAERGEEAPALAWLDGGVGRRDVRVHLHAWPCERRDAADGLNGLGPRWAGRGASAARRGCFVADH